MILGSESEVWLRDNYPGLQVTDDSISGTIEFRATFDQSVNYFVVLPRDYSEQVSGVVLDCRFEIAIRYRTAKAASELPALYVTGIPPIPDRHCELTGIACLCSPLEEDEFLVPTFQFQLFFEKLVIPYLYGQEFFNRYGHWPWGEYAHGVTGLLESFTRVDLTKTDTCLKKLATTPEWPKVRYLLQRNQIGGHNPCVCGKHEHFRRCNKQALEGLRRLHRAIRDQGLTVA